MSRLCSIDSLIEGSTCESGSIRARTCGRCCDCALNRTTAYSLLGTMSLVRNMVILSAVSLETSRQRGQNPHRTPDDNTRQACQAAFRELPLLPLSPAEPTATANPPSGIPTVPAPAAWRSDDASSLGNPAVGTRLHDGLAPSPGCARSSSCRSTRPLDSSAERRSTGTMGPWG